MVSEGSGTESGGRVVSMLRSGDEGLEVRSVAGNARARVRGRVENESVRRRVMKLRRAIIEVLKVEFEISAS